MGITAVLRLSMLPAQMLLLSKEDPMMVEVITMVVVVDMDVEVGDMVVMKVVMVVPRSMEVMVDVAALAGSIMEVAVCMVVVVDEEVGFTSVGKMGILQGNVVKVVDMSILPTFATFPF
ncbi:hypothetical protein H5410_063975 [Solanum commersonii]|uniref:Uncharacterized protein n=1 Tax=Solanum commersonii TaxID=4109 RepID=A0A9J5W0X8_SOLCO|nr:hypothetical protein H5410_063975 [Solanum commersonii]